MDVRTGGVATRYMCGEMRLRHLLRRTALALVANGAQSHTVHGVALSGTLQTAVVHRVGRRSAAAPYGVCGAPNHHQAPSLEAMAAGQPGNHSIRSPL
jgi:hypothetical protein